MMITAWRITQKKHVASAFSGLGAWLEGARWNPRGTYLVYTAESISLAAFELLVNLPERSKLYSLYVRIAVAFDAYQVTTLGQSELPPDWDSYPPTEATQKMGEDWIKSNKSLVLRVPSSVIPEECNYLINPAHEDFKTIKIGKAKPFVYDPRVAK